MVKKLLTSTWALFAFSIFWGGWLLLWGSIPNVLADRGPESLTFELRDYLLRAFVIFLIAHLCVKQTNFKLLFAVPPLTLLIQQGLDVYALIDWYAAKYNRNVHELNAQLLVVPVQLATLVAGIYFCSRQHLRSTTRIFATVMLAGSVLSTVGFHFALISVSYKPIERVYSANLKSISELASPEALCETMGYECFFYPLDSKDWQRDLFLDPQLRGAHGELLGELLATQVWVRRGVGADRWLGLANITEDGVDLKEIKLPSELIMPAVSHIGGEAECPTHHDALCWDSLTGPDGPHLMPYSQSVAEGFGTADNFWHVWAHVYDFERRKLEPALFVAGRRDGGPLRVVILRLPRSETLALSDAVANRLCPEDMLCRHLKAEEIVDHETLPELPYLADTARLRSDKGLRRVWVDKALSTNPVLYINRPEFLRLMKYDNGYFRIMTTPQAFSDMTMDLKVSFNLIIALFSMSWLSLGVFLILFHTRRQLMRAQ